MRVGLYIRVSTQEQAEEGYSISAQEDKLRNYCKAKDWTVSGVYIDPGFSGAKMERPALTKMMDDIQNKRIDMVLVYKLDRLSRSQKDTLYLIEDVFLENGVDFVSMTENFDTSTPLGRAMIGILSVFAQLERERIKERMGLGLEARAKDGLFHGGGYIPIGYDYVDSRLIINEYEAMQIRTVVDLFLNKGWAITRIRDYMSTNYTTKYGNWYSDSSIRSILKTPLYYGMIAYKGEIYQGQHEPIYSKETFDKIQERFEQLDKTKKGQWLTPFNATTLLSGLIYCGNCGGRYYCKHNTSRNKELPAQRYYVCYSRGKTNKRLIKDPNCKNKNWNTKILDQIIVDEIKKLAFDGSYFNEVAHQDEPSGNTEAMDKRIKSIDKQIGKLVELYQLEDIDFSTIKTKIENLNKEKISLQNEKSTLDSKEPKVLEVKTKLLSVNDIFENGTLEEQRLLIQSLIDRIELLDDQVTIHWSFV